MIISNINKLSVKNLGLNVNYHFIKTTNEL